MKKSKFVKSFKANWKNILSAVLVGALLFGSVVGVTSFLNKDTKKIPSSAFAVGGIDENGNYEKSDVSIYTKDMFECQGLTIEPDFEATGTYQVFYYGADKNFIGTTDGLDATEGVYTKGDTYIFAKYARIMITPDIPTDEDGNVEEDFKIRFYEVTSYAGVYTITVNKKQDNKYSNMESVFVRDEANAGKYYSNTLYTLSESVNYIPSEIIAVEDKNEVHIFMSEMYSGALTQLCIANSEGVIIETINLDKINCVLEGSQYYLKYELPSDASKIVLNAVSHVDYLIYIF